MYWIVYWIVCNVGDDLFVFVGDFNDWCNDLVVLFGEIGLFEVVMLFGELGCMFFVFLLVFVFDKMFVCGLMLFEWCVLFGEVVWLLDYLLYIVCLCFDL